MSDFAWRARFVLTLVLTSVLTGVPGFAREVPVGVNVNSFQNFSAADQQTIVDQLKRSGAGFVRTSLRPDDKNMKLAKNLQSQGIGLVLVVGPVFLPNAQLRRADEKRHMRSAIPLSAADPELSKAYYQTVFDKLDAYGVRLTGIEVGNEINWPDFNGDFPVPGQGKAFTLDDLSRDPEAKRVAEGLLEYLKGADRLEGGERSFEAQPACPHHICRNGDGKRRRVAAKASTRQLLDSRHLRLSSCPRAG
jgi:hypothetical protein